MISAGDFRNGITLEIEGNVYQIVEFQHVKPGKYNFQTRFRVTQAFGKVNGM